MRIGCFSSTFVKKFCSRLVTGVIALLLTPQLAFAYVGPGAGLTAIGTVLALIGAVLLGIFGFIWYPVKRLLRGRKSTEDDEIDDAAEDLVPVGDRRDSTSGDRRDST